jgi:hypothetical protein
VVNRLADRTGTIVGGIRCCFVDRTAAVVSQRFPGRDRLTYTDLPSGSTDQQSKLSRRMRDDFTNRLWVTVDQANGTPTKGSVVGDNDPTAGSTVTASVFAPPTSSMRRVPPV